MPSSCMITYPPDVNVLKGYQQGAGPPATRWCTGTPHGSDTGPTPSWPTDVSTATDPASKSHPVDSCFTTGSCSPSNIGNGTWNCQSYWNVSHPPALGHSAPSGCTSAATISRYSVYQYEISHNYLGDANVTTGETGAPQCSAATAQADRRILSVAIINCGSSPVPIQSNASNVPVAAFGKFFLTVPVPTAGANKPYAEFLGLVGRGPGTGSFDQVQLYR
jgi:hypothetical protein